MERRFVSTVMQLSTAVSVCPIILGLMHAGRGSPCWRERVRPLSILFTHHTVHMTTSGVGISPAEIWCLESVHNKINTWIRIPQFLCPYSTRTLLIVIVCLLQHMIVIRNCLGRGLGQRGRRSTLYTPPLKWSTRWHAGTALQTICHTHSQCRLEHLLTFFFLNTSLL